MRCLNQLDENIEISRRQAFYKFLSKHAIDFNLSPVFQYLPEHVVPYGLPIYSNDGLDVHNFAKIFKLDYFRWPDLPKDIVQNAPQHYKNLYLLNFL